MRIPSILAMLLLLMVLPRVHADDVPTCAGAGCDAVIDGERAPAPTIEAERASATSDTRAPAAEAPRANPEPPRQSDSGTRATTSPERGRDAIANQLSSAVNQCQAHFDRTEASCRPSRADSIDVKNSGGGMKSASADTAKALGAVAERTQGKIKVCREAISQCRSDCGARLEQLQATCKDCNDSDFLPLQNLIHRCVAQKFFLEQYRRVAENAGKGRDEAERGGRSVGDITSDDDDKRPRPPRRPANDGPSVPVAGNGGGGGATRDPSPPVVTHTHPVGSGGLGGAMSGGGGGGLTPTSLPRSGETTVVNKDPATREPDAGKDRGSSRTKNTDVAQLERPDGARAQAQLAQPNGAMAPMGMNGMGMYPGGGLMPMSSARGVPPTARNGSTPTPANTTTVNTVIQGGSGPASSAAPVARAGFLAGVKPRRPANAQQLATGAPAVALNPQVIHVNHQGGTSGLRGPSQSSDMNGFERTVTLDARAPHDYRPHSNATELNARMNNLEVNAAGGGGGGSNGAPPNPPLSAYLPNGTHYRGTRGPAGLDASQSGQGIQSMAVDIWGQVSQRFRAHCLDGRLRDCRLAPTDTDND